MPSSSSRRRFLTAAAAALLPAACQRNKRRTIAVIPKANSHLFWLSVKQGAEKAGSEFDVDILWNGPASETDYSRQIQIVDSMVARRVDGIALAASERKALAGAVDRAMAAGIPVAVFDSGIDSENYLSFIATDNVEAGREAARTLAGLLDGKGRVAMLMHSPGSLSSMDRERGFTEELSQRFPGIQLVASQFGMSDRAKAMAATENILTAHPNLNGMFASAEPSSIGAAQAFKARQLAGKLKLVVFDSSETLIDDLRNGVTDAMIVQEPARMGYQAVRAIIEKLNGRPPAKRVDMAALVVRKPDLEKPEIKALLSLK